MRGAQAPVLLCCKTAFQRMREPPRKASSSIRWLPDVFSRLHHQHARVPYVGMSFSGLLPQVRHSSYIVPLDYMFKQTEPRFPISETRNILNTIAVRLLKPTEVSGKDQCSSMERHTRPCLWKLSTYYFLANGTFWNPTAWVNLHVCVSLSLQLTSVQMGTSSSAGAED